MMGADVRQRYKTKKSLKEAVGAEPDFEETSMFGKEFHGDGSYTVVGPHPYSRKWYATVAVVSGVISKVE